MLGVNIFTTIGKKKKPKDDWDPFSSMGKGKE